MKIVEATTKDVNRVRSRGRVRSRETLTLIDKIESLGPWDVGVERITPGQSTREVKSRLRQAARLAGIKLGFTDDEDRVFYYVRKT